MERPPLADVQVEITIERLFEEVVVLNQQALLRGKAWAATGIFDRAEVVAILPGGVR